jgi:Pretoxin HINT domain/Bacterial Ig-like domain/Alpha-2-macroglobulin family
MENSDNQDEKNIKDPGAGRNENAGGTLEEMESKISMLINHNNASASDQFRESLKTRVLQAHAKNNMPRSRGFKNLIGLFTVRRFSFAITIVLILAVVSGVMLSGYFGGGVKNAAKIFINPAYAADDFSLVPLAGDSTGVTPDSAYKLTSKEVFATADIKAGLSVTPDVKIAIAQTADKEWVITPSEKLPANSLIKIALATSVNNNGTVSPRDFSWAFQVKDHFRVLSSTPGNAATNVPINTGIEVTFSHPNLAGYENNFSISPAVKGSFEYHARTAVFVPTEPLAAGELYTVTVSGKLGLTGSDEKLGEDYIFSFETAKLDNSATQAWFGVDQKMLQFRPDETPFIGVYGDTSVAVAVDVYSFASADAFIIGLNERNKYPAWSEKWNDYLFDTAKLAKAASFSPKIETQNYANFVSFPSKLPVGFYLAEVSYQGKKTQVWMEINDLNIMYNIDVNRVLVWANRVGDKAPVADAEVSAGDLVQNIKTDADGVATFDIPAAYRDPKSKYVDLPTYLIVRDGASATVSAINLGSSQSASYWSYFYTDRPRYQSDDTINFWVMTRGRADETVPQGKYSVILRKSGWYDYYYNPVKIAEVDVAPDAYGTMTGAIQIKDLKPDSYEVALTLDGQDVVSRWISVLPYVKPAYSITVSADRSAAFAGEQVTFTAEAKFFDGTPAAGIKLKVAADGQNASLGTFTTDEQGKITFSDTQQYDETTNWPRSVYYTVSPESAELGDISGYASATWYGPRVYGTSEVKYPEKGRAELDIKVRNVDMNKINNGSTFSYDDGWQGSDPASGAVISGEVDKISYVKVETGTAYDFVNKTSYKTYRYDQHTDKVDALSFVTGADGMARYSRAVEPENYYELIYTVSDAAGRKEQHYDYFYYYDGNTYYRDYDAFGDDTQPTIEFNRSDRTYSLNDEVKATLSVAAKPVLPNPGDRFLFAKYQNGLKNWTVQAEPVYSFNFSESDIPNVQLFAAWWDGKNYQTTRTDGWWGSSDGGAKYNFTDRELTISASFDKASYAPGDNAKINLTVKDKNGEPVRAALNLNLIDEAYYAVASDSANPLATIFTPLYSGLVDSEQSQVLGLAPAAGAERGGCFAAGTLITMADGSQKPIEKVKVNDKVATLANPLNANVVSGTVSAIFAHVSNKMISVNGGLLRATPEHMIYASGTFKTAGELQKGDVLIGLNGKKIVVNSTEIVFEKMPVYNLRVDPYHTFIANGIYVHNDKDGPVRQTFVDIALFKTVETDSAGAATVDFKLPDNVTTWRLTTQAIGKDLSAGVTVEKIKATLPAFIDVTVGKDYLAGDQVVAKLRAFGASLTATDAVSFSVAAPSLGNASFLYNAQGKAYAPAEVSLPPLAAGKYDVTYSMKSQKGNDAVLLPINAVSSFLKVNKILSTADVAPGMKFSAPGATGSVRITFADASGTHLYAPLAELSYAWGKRVDQALGHAIASDLLLKYFKEDWHEDNFDGSVYEQADGGIALLPYGSSDMDLSARLAALAPEKFDVASLGQYFMGEIDSANATPETVSDALLGLASLGDPVLPRLELWKDRTDLTNESKMRVALALYKMGAFEDARAIYNDVLKNGEKRGAYYLLSGADPNATLANTAFLAELAAALNMPERDELWAYVTDHKNNDKIEVLTNLEDLSFVLFTIPTFTPGPSKVEYEINGVKDTIDFNGWGDSAVSVQAVDLDKVKIDSVEGKISATVSAEMPASVSGLTASNDVSITRSYAVLGAKEMSVPAPSFFNDGDIVRVNLDATISRNSPDNNYQVTDILPAGLAPVTDPINPYAVDYSVSWLNPFDINGQLVSFNVWKTGNPDANGNYSAHISYYARVKTKGVYKAEPAVIQGFADPGTINFTSAETITIK